MRAYLVTAVLAASFLGSAGFASAANVCGDVNDSGSVSTSDALAVLKRGVGQDIGLTCGPTGAPVQTGQFTAFGSGSDGDLTLGSPRTFIDNGDGTITDSSTGLMWEKKDDASGIHDKDSLFTWSVSANNMNGTLASVFLANLNAGGGFAGHTDWRIPNRFELETLLNLGAVNPSTHFRFNQFCAPACTISTCSCTTSGFYWTSTTASASVGDAWMISFAGAGVGTDGKLGNAYARAVRTAGNLTTTPTCQAPDPPQCTFNDPCTDGTCSLSRTACSTQANCPLSPDEQCCCAGICL